MLYLSHSLVWIAGVAALVTLGRRALSDKRVVSCVRVCALVLFLVFDAAGVATASEVWENCAAVAMAVFVVALLVEWNSKPRRRNSGTDSSSKAARTQ